MALHPDFPTSPYEVLSPEQRWFPAAEKTEGVDGSQRQDESGTRYSFVYVGQENFELYKPSTFAGLASTFREYQELAP